MVFWDYCFLKTNANIRLSNDAANCFLGQRRLLSLQAIINDFGLFRKALYIK